VLRTRFHRVVFNDWGIPVPVFYRLWWCIFMADQSNTQFYFGISIRRCRQQMVGSQMQGC